MGVGSSRSYVVSVTPERQSMIKIIDRLIVLDDAVKNGMSLTRVEEKERKQLLKISKEMKKVQIFYNSNVNPI